MRVPTIHLNGTSKERLLIDYEKAHRAVNTAMDTLNQIEFNARDYYVQGPLAWSEAVQEMRVRFSMLAQIKSELETILEKLDK